MKLSDLFQFRIRKEIIEDRLKILNEELEKVGAKYRVTWTRMYDRPYLRVCPAEHFDKEHLYCSIVTADIPFSTRQDLFNAIMALGFTTKRYD